MIKLTIPKYIKHIQISKSRRKKYYHTTASLKKSKKIQEGLSKGIYSWRIINGKTTLVDENKLPIIANPKSYGTPNIIKINGQDSLYDKHLLGKIKLEMVDFFNPFFENLEIKENDLPIKVNYEIHGVVYDKNPWDLDNRASIYRKVLQDIIKTKMIGDDNVLFLTSYEVNFVPIENEEDRKIIVEITKDNRPSLLKKFYLKLRKEWLIKFE
jgi:hypothetical protein